MEEQGQQSDSEALSDHGSSTASRDAGLPLASRLSPAPPHNNTLQATGRWREDH